MDRDTQPQMENRVTTLETQVTAIRDDIHSIKQGQSDHNERVERLISGMQSEMAKSGKTNWGVFVSIAGLVVMIVTVLGGMAIAPVISAVEVNQEALRLVNDKLDGHAALHSHPAAQVEFEGLEKRIEILGLLEDKKVELLQLQLNQMNEEIKFLRSQSP